MMDDRPLRSYPLPSPPRGRPLPRGGAAGGGGGGGGGVLALAWALYQRQLRTRPLRTKAITAAAVAALSDVLSQRLAAPRGARRPDLRQTALTALFGLLVSGPSNHYWQDLLEHRLLPRRAKRGGEEDALRVVKAAVLDQVAYGPAINLAWMLFASLILQRQPARAAAARVRVDFWPIQRAAWRVWLPAALVSQAAVPLRLRVLWANAVGLGWGAFLIARTRAAPW